MGQAYHFNSPVGLVQQPPLLDSKRKKISLTPVLTPGDLCVKSWICRKKKKTENVKAMDNKPVSIALFRKD
jgi:hypothetical protein